MNDIFGKNSFSLYSYLSLVILLFAIFVFLGNVYRLHLERWDDAYITFRFAQHLADGQGLIWNIGGERVEGFTSFLHVSLLAFGIKAGINPWIGSLAISILSVFATASMMLMIVRRQLGNINPLAAIIIGTYLIDSATAIHTTSGLETQLFVAVICACYFFAFLFIDTPRWSSAIYLGVFVFLSCLCRPEAVIYGAGLYFALAVYCFSNANNQENIKQKLAKLSLSSGIVLFCGLAYVFWKLNYFGYLLPNPYYVKSNKFAFSGISEVSDYVKHLIKWFAPLLLGGTFLFVKDKATALSFFTKSKARAKILLTLTPPVLALAYYSTIIHEVGGGFRFSYPTYFYFVLGFSVFLTVLVRSTQLSNVGRHILLAIALLLLAALFLSQKSWRFSPIPPSDFNQYHFKIAEALEATGLGSKGTILCDAAGIIPYVSGFNQVDRVGLVNNFLSGRNPVSPEEREEYIWSRPLDVYVGFEPPAQIGAETPEDDLQMKTQYVSEILLQKKLTLVESRIFIQDAKLLHSRMRELRDNWDLVGEMEWAGWTAWKIKSFVYVKRNSPYAPQLISELSRIVKVAPAQINLNNIDTH
jgi:arabinofuranosyltransferase